MCNGFVGVGEETVDGREGGCRGQVDIEIRTRSRLTKLMKNEEIDEGKRKHFALIAHVII